MPYGNDRVWYNSDIVGIYERGIIYKYKNGSFNKEESFNTHIFELKYADITGCPKNKMWLYHPNSEEIYSQVVIHLGEVTFIKSDLDAESKPIIKEALEEAFAQSQDTLYIEFNYFNVKNVRCIEN